MFDSRTKSVTMSVDHESPVESLIFLPSGSLLISAGNFTFLFPKNLKYFLIFEISLKLTVNYNVLCFTFTVKLV